MKVGGPAALFLEPADTLSAAEAFLKCFEAGVRVFVLGGGMSKAGDMLLGVVKKHYQHYAFHAARNTAFEFATLSNSAGIYGAAKLVIKED